MSIKKFSILTSIVVGIMLVVTIVLSCITVNVPVSAVPDQFIVYNETAAGTTYDSHRPTKYEQLCKLYKKMTKLSIFDYMVKGHSLVKKPTQDLDNDKGNWTDNNKSNYVCLEMLFDEEQVVVVEIDGDTKAIRFNSLIMKVEKSTLSHDVAIYFSTSTSSYRSYQANPIVVHANQNKLYKYIKSLAD